MTHVKPRHPLERITKRLGLSRVEIARRYGCSEQFVYAVFSGKSACPPRLAQEIRDMIAERAADAARILLDPGSIAIETQGRRVGI